MVTRSSISPKRKEDQRIGKRMWMFKEVNHFSVFCSLLLLNQISRFGRTFSSTLTSVKEFVEETSRTFAGEST